MLATYFVGENTNPTAGSRIGCCATHTDQPFDGHHLTLALGVVGKTRPGPGKGGPDRTLCGEMAKISIIQIGGSSANKAGCVCVRGDTSLTFM